MTRVVAALLALGLGLCISAGADAQKLSAKAEIDERYTDTAQTSGFLLAGVVYGSIDGLFDPDSLSLHAPTSPSSESLCFRLASRDGRYRGLAEYTAPLPSPGFAYLDFRSRYSDRLRKLRASDLAPRMITSKNCQDGSIGTVIPVSLSGARNAQSLLALINPGEARVSAQIVDATGHTVTGGWMPCENATTGANVVFTQTCKLALDGTAARGQATLELRIVELIGRPFMERFILQFATR
jgi:hypothetical protein